MSTKDKVISLGTYPKRAGDISDIAFDYKKLIPDGESISSHTSHIEKMDGTDMDGTMNDSSDIDGTFIMFRVISGTVGETYRAIVSATMSGGSKYYAEVLVEVVAE